MTQISMARILENGKLSVQVGVLTEKDFETIAQGLTLVIIEQQKIVSEANELLEMIDSCGASSAGGVSLADLRKILEDAKASIEGCDNIIKQLRLAFNYPENEWTAPLSSLAALMGALKPE